MDGGDPSPSPPSLVRSARPRSASPPSSAGMGASESRELRLLTLASTGDAAGLRALWKEEQSRRSSPPSSRPAPLDVDFHLPDGDCALHLAALHPTAECCEVLVDDFGCDVDERDGSGATALMFAVEARSEAVLRFLCLSTQADVDAADEGGRTALHRAAQSNQSALLRLLLRTQPRVDCQDGEGNSPLHAALLHHWRAELEAAGPGTPPQALRGLVSPAPPAASHLSGSRRHSRRVSAGEVELGVVDDLLHPQSFFPPPLDAASTPSFSRHRLSGSAAPSGVEAFRSSPPASSPATPSSRWSAGGSGREEVVVRLLAAGADPSLRNAKGQSGWALASQVGLLDLCATAVRKRERDRIGEVERSLHGLLAPAAAAPDHRLPLAVLEAIRAYDSHQRLPSPALGERRLSLSTGGGVASSTAPSPVVSSSASPQPSRRSLSLLHAATAGPAGAAAAVSSAVRVASASAPSIRQRLSASRRRRRGPSYLSVNTSEDAAAAAPHSAQAEDEAGEDDEGDEDEELQPLDGDSPSPSPLSVEAP